MLGRRRIRADEQDTHVGVMRPRGPHLLAVDDKVIPVLDRPGLQRGDIRAGAGLRIALTPDLLGGENFRQIALFLLLGRPMHQGRTDQRDAQAVDQGRRLDPPELLAKDDTLLEFRPAPAVSLGPRDPDPAATVHLAMPPEMPPPALAAGVHELADLIVGAAVAGRVDVEPRAKFPPKSLGFFAIFEVHR